MSDFGDRQPGCKRKSNSDDKQSQRKENANVFFSPHWPSSCRRVLSAAAAESRSAVERLQPRYRRALGGVLHLAAHWIPLLSGAFLPFTGELLRVSDYKVHPSSLLAVSLLYAASCRLMEQEIYILGFDCSRYRGQRNGFVDRAGFRQTKPTGTQPHSAVLMLMLLKALA